MLYGREPVCLIFFTTWKDDIRAIPFEILRGAEWKISRTPLTYFHFLEDPHIFLFFMDPFAYFFIFDSTPFKISNGIVLRIWGKFGLLYRTSGQFYMLQLNSVDYGHFKQPYRSIM